MLTLSAIKVELYQVILCNTTFLLYFTVINSNEKLQI